MDHRYSGQAAPRPSGARHQVDAKRAASANISPQWTYRRQLPLIRPGYRGPLTRWLSSGLAPRRTGRSPDSAQGTGPVVSLVLSRWSVGDDEVVADLEDAVARARSVIAWPATPHSSRPRP